MIIWFGRIIPSVQVLECWSVYACGCANFLHNSSCGDVFSVFVVKIVLMTQASFCYCWAVLAWSQGLFCSSPHPICKEAGSAQGIGTAHPADPRGYPTPYVVILGIQSWEKKEEWGAFVLIVHDGALLSWAWLNTACPWEEMSEFHALLVCVTFALSIKLSLPQPMNGLNPISLILSPIPCRGKWASRWVDLAAYWH